jgi:hypothetical protein
MGYAGYSVQLCIHQQHKFFDVYYLTFIRSLVFDDPMLRISTQCLSNCSI